MTGPSRDAHSSESGGKRRLSRRSLLTLSAGTTAALTGCLVFGSSPQRTADEPTEEPPSTDEAIQPETARPDRTWESEFERVVDAVEDLGCDPTGDTASDSALVDGVASDVLIRFPAGTYRFERRHVFDEFDRLGFVGDGDVSFAPPRGFNDKLFNFLGDWLLFAGIDIDVSATDTTAGLRFVTDSGFHVEDVEVRGRGIHPDSSVVNAFALGVGDADGRGVLRNVVATEGSAIGHYKSGNGRVGIWIGGSHHGTIEIEDCHLAEFGNNGIYGSRTSGAVVVTGGLYRNNNVAGVRLGGGNSVVRGATIEVDLSVYTGPYTRTNSAYNTRAIVVEQESKDLAGRVLIEDCDVRMINADRSQGAIVVWPTGNGPRIERCHIKNEVDWVSGVQANKPVSTGSTGERGIELRDTTIAGGASWGSAVEVVGRPASTCVDVTIDQRGRNRDGIRLVGSNPINIASSTITTTRYPIFAVNPRGGKVPCLVSLSSDSTLERTGPALGSVRTTESAVGESDQTSAGGTAGDSDNRCLGSDLVETLDPYEGVGITAVEEGTITWRPHLTLEQSGQ